MEQQYGSNEYYLDTHTGELVIIPSELGSLEAFGDEELAKLPEWQRKHLSIAQEIFKEVDRYEPVPTADPYEFYELMVEFAQTVSDHRLREKLEIVLDGRDAVRRFKRLLACHPQERERWFDYKLAAMFKRIRKWLKELDIEPVEKKRRSRP